MVRVLALYVPFFIAFVAVCGKRGFLGAPVSLLALFNAVGLVGLAGLADMDFRPDRVYVWFMFAMAVMTCVLATTWGVLFRTRRPVMARESLAVISVTPAFVALYVVSLLLTILYYRAVGHVTLLSSLTSGGGYDAATARLNSYAGASYFAPGYINQFKNAILPCLTLALIHRLWVRKAPLRLFWSVILGVVAVVAVAGTGQRGALVLFMVATFIALRAGSYIRGRSVIWVMVGFTALFSFLTYLNGRSRDELAEADGPFAKVRVLVNALLSRVFDEQALSGLAGFRYTYGLATANGKEWVEDVLGILPGYRGSTLSNQIFASLYGSDRGTSPPSTWGSAYYNFGLVGSLVVGAAAIAFYAWMSTKLYLVKAGTQLTELNSLQAAGLAGLAVSTGAWIAGSPLALLNQGAAAYLFVYWFGCRLQSREAADARVGRASPGRIGARGQSAPRRRARASDRRRLTALESQR